MDNLLDSRERFISKLPSYSSPLTEFWNIYVKLYSDAHLFSSWSFPTETKRRCIVSFSVIFYLILEKSTLLTALES